MSDQGPIPQEARRKPVVSGAVPSRVFWLLSAMAILGAAGLFTQTLGFGAAHDDYLAFQDPVRSLGIRDALTEFTHHGLWMPMVYLDFMAATKIFGTITMVANAQPDSIVIGVNPTWLHAENLIQHIANALLLIMIAWNLVRDRLVAVCVGLFWMIHPVQMDTVALIAERKNTLSTLFMLASLLVYCHYSVSRKILTGALCFTLFCLASASKPTVLLLPVLLLVLDAYHVQFDLRKLSFGQWLEKLPFFAVALGVGFIDLVGETLAAPRTPGDMLTGAANLAGYVTHIFWPVQLRQAYPEYGTDLAMRATIGGVILIALLMLALVCRHKKPLVSVGLLWFVIFLIPALNLGMVIGLSPIYDHNVYLPLAGLALALAAASPDMLRYVAPPVLIALAAALLHQAHRWNHYDASEFTKAMTVHAHGKLQACQQNYATDPKRALQCLNAVAASTRYIWPRQEASIIRTRYLAILGDTPGLRHNQAELNQIHRQISTTNASHWWMRLYEVLRTHRKVVA